MIYGIGTDIIEVDRIARAVERWGDNFLTHVFTPAEIAYAQQHRNPYPFFAGRFAAKEAVFKAISNRAIGWQDLEIIHDAFGRPVCLYRDQTFPHKIWLSISHTKNYAVANALITA